MAQIGRQKSNVYLADQAEMPASSSALPSTKNILTSVSRLSPRLRDRACAITAQWPGGNSVPGPSAQYSAIIFLVSERLLVSARAVSMSFGSYEPSASFGGPGGTNWLGAVSANEVTFFHCGVYGFWIV